MIRCFEQFEKSRRPNIWVVSTKISYTFSKNIEEHHTYIHEELHKKGTTLHPAPQITLFFDSPCINGHLGQ